MCTTITLKTADQYFGRVMDSVEDKTLQICVTPRNYPLYFHHEKGLSRHYAMLGIASVEKEYPLYYEAINEKGVAMAGLNLYGNTYYKDLDTNQKKIAPFEMIAWVLAQCATIQEVRKIVMNTNVVPEVFDKTIPITPLHWHVSDGKESIVIECNPYGLQVYDNPVGVLTNNPEFPIQFHYLNNYMALSKQRICNHFSDQISFDVYSSGLGALGLPGDYSSTSRFVRATFLKYNALLKHSEAESVSQCFHILDSVKQIHGVNEVAEGKYEKSIYMCCYNTTKQILYYKTYTSQQLVSYDLHKENIEASRLIYTPLKDEFCVLQQNG